MPDLDGVTRTYTAQQAAVQHEHEYTLPSGESPTLALIQPNAVQIRQQCKANAISWRGALPMEAYVRREDHLRRSGIAKDSGLSHWILIDTAAPSGCEEVLAGCETLRKYALVVREDSDGAVEESICHAVGCVFTPERFRGKGYGARMIHELGQKLHLWQTQQELKPALFSVLYSDIGKKFYDKFHWKPHRSTHIHLPAARVPRRISERTDIQVQLLYATDLPELCRADEALQRQHVVAHSRTHPTRPSVVLLADHETIEWHHAREDFVSNELFARSPKVKGAIATIPPRATANGDGSSSSASPTRVWAIWTRVWYNPDLSTAEKNRMYILRLVVDSEATRRGELNLPQDEDIATAAAAIFQVAQQQASEWNMEFIEIWNPLDASVREACRRADPQLGSTLVEREEDSIASLRWYGGGAGDTEGIEWLENEKYGWC